MKYVARLWRLLWPCTKPKVLAKDETYEEIGKVTETKGSVFGSKFDNGYGYQSF